MKKSFPRLRGGDPLGQHGSLVVVLLFPAYAGVIPRTCYTDKVDESFPRLRGGDPSRFFFRKAERAFSPPTRG